MCVCVCVVDWPVNYSQSQLFSHSFFFSHWLDSLIGLILTICRWNTESCSRRSQSSCCVVVVVVVVVVVDVVVVVVV